HGASSNLERLRQQPREFPQEGGAGPPLPPELLPSKRRQDHLPHVGGDDLGEGRAVGLLGLSLDARRMPWTSTWTLTSSRVDSFAHLGQHGDDPRQTSLVGFPLALVAQGESEGYLVLKFRPGQAPGH